MTHGGRPLVWVGVILAVALVAGYLARPRGQRATDVRRTSLRTTPDGVAALARGIDRLGRRTAPRITPLVEADPVRGTVVLLQPPLFPSPREVVALLARVRDGGTLVYAPPYRTERGRTTTTPLMDSLGVYFRFRSPQEEFRAFKLGKPGWGEHVLTDALPPPLAIDHGLRVLGEHGEDGEDEDTATSRVQAVERLMTVEDSTDGEWLAAAELTLGDGRIMLFADAASLSNGEAAENPLAVLAVRAALAYTGEADTVFFAEFHQGIRGSRTRAEVLRDFFLGSPGGRTLFHLVAVCFLILACFGLRFGAPAPAVAPPDLERRSPLEHVSALGDLYRKAGASGTAALLLLARLARAARHPPPRDMAEADSLLRKLDAGEGPDTPLGRAREGLHANPADLTMIAAGVDQHLARRSNP